MPHRTITQANKRQQKKLRDALDALSNEVFSTVLPRTDIGFLDCLKTCPAELRARWQDAYNAVDTYDNHLVSERRAYRGTFGMLIAY